MGTTKGQRNPGFGSAAATVAGGMALAALGAAGLAFFSSYDFDDLANAYPWPERKALVRELSGTSGHGEWRVWGDFDGDGTRDELDVEYHPMQPLFGERTAGLLRVTSGRTGDVLLAHALPTPINPASWCGDVDGDGRDDVQVEDGELRVFCFKGDR